MKPTGSMNRCGMRGAVTKIRPVRIMQTNIRWSARFLSFAICFAILGETRLVPAQSVPVAAGYRDFNFGAVSSAEPTYGKSESKLWWNDGLWWGYLWNPATNQYEIYRFEAATQNWTATHVAVDVRSTSRADVLWDGRYLYIASHYYSTRPGPTSVLNVSQLFRFSYAPAAKQYTLDDGFPVDINDSKTETLTLDKDSTGQLWITWVEDGKVMINRTLGNDLTWGDPFVLPVQGGDTDPDDISALAAFGGNQIGVMWSNQRDSTNYFAVHRDGDADEVWQAREVALSGAGIGPIVDDHLNLKASCQSGDLYAAAVTNLAGGASTSIFVLQRSAAGIWTPHAFATSSLNHSRPMLALDEENQRLYVFARSTDTGPGWVYMKSANLNDLVFPEGLGTPILQSATDIDITNPASTKQCVNPTTGILVLAADKDSRYYLHNRIDILGSAPQITHFFPTRGPAGTEVTIAGDNFASVTKVFFNGVPAARFTIDDDTQIRATVPAGASSGKITVINAFGVGASAIDYVVTTPPAIFSFTPTNGPVGALVTITGNNFIGTTKVDFNGVSATGFVIDSNTQIRAYVPAGATTGLIRVTNPDGVAVSPNIFTVILPPLITSFAPLRGVVGTEITISGNHFTGVTSVSLNGKPAAFALNSDTLLLTKVPAGATTGPITVTNAAGSVTSAVNFTKLHTLTVLYAGSGSVTLNPPGGVYDDGAVVTLTAQPAEGWEFRDWDGDVEGTNPTTTILMNGDKRVTAKFQTRLQYAVTINTVGAGQVALDPPGGLYYGGTTVKLIATPQPGNVFSGYAGAFKGWMNVETITVDANKNLTATFSPLPAPRHAMGIFTSAAEVSKLPISGLGWGNLKAGADAPSATPNLADKEDSVNVAVLAKALVYSRTGEEVYRQSVIAACMAAMGTEQNGETLALGRKLLAYVLAADLVSLPATEEAKFKNWLRNLLSQDVGGQTLRSANETRPNNWGLHCGATRAAIARYLGDATELERTARVFKGWLGDRAAYADFSYEPAGLSWQADPGAPVGINPVGATIQGHSVDGVLPDDQRRSGPFAWPPPKENYVYGALQGALMQAIILYRAGYDVWNWQDQALLRALRWLYTEANYPANWDDKWLIHSVNHFYQTHFPAPFPAGPGKNAGWTDWLYGSPYALTVRDNNGDVEIHALGNNSGNLMVMQLLAVPQANYVFTNWSGDWSGAKNPDTLVMNADKNVVANFMKQVLYNLNVQVVGDGKVTMDPPGGIYLTGAVVTLTATPNPGFKFTGWSGDLNSESNPVSLTIIANQNITATFKPIYNLSVNVVSAGTVALDPPKGPYEIGSVVTLTAQPNPGYQFVEWSGDLHGAENPATLTIDGHKIVQATFAAIRVAHAEMKIGGATSSAVIMTEDSLAGVKDHLYLAAITTRPPVPVSSISGLGLVWTPVKAQCSGRSTIGVEVWMAQGEPAGDDAVTVSLFTAPYNAALVVSRYSGAASINPLGDVLSGNTRGLNGACTGGLDNASYSFNLNTTANGALVFAVAGMRNRTHTQGVSYIERTEIKQGSGSSAVAVIVEDKIFPAAGLAMLNGTFNGNADWAVVAVEIKPEAIGKPEDFSDDKLNGDPPGPLTYQLLPNFPNPFNVQTNIVYTLPEETTVSLSIYNLSGQKVRTLVDGLQSAGRNQVLWDGADNEDRPLGSGIYLVCLKTRARQLTRRVLLLK